MDTKRFNNPEYKKQIKAVRNYRRVKPSAPPGKTQKVLHGVGLPNIKSQIFALLLVALFVYIFYFAKFLMIREIKIEGVDAQASTEISKNFEDFAKTHRWYIFPERNVLFFSKSAFSSYLLKNNYKVAAVDQIQSKLWNNLSIKVQQRTEKYSLQVGPNSYILNSDSTIGAQLPVAAPDQPIAAPTHLVIKDTADETVSSGDKFLDPDKNSFLQKVSADIESKLSLPIESYEVPGKASDQMTVYLKKGFKVYFTTTTDPDLYFQRFYTLWLQLTPDQQDKLAYFDLRFDKNAYSCNKADPCAAAIIK
ncbi:MAG: Cell division protein FtsQ [Candidatus Doudnabacteria bacterium]|nr:Cell division protein FtsQ [Candidatus Doudnabacteria bacterium]